MGIDSGDQIPAALQVSTPAQLYEGLLRLHTNPTSGDKLLSEIGNRHIR
ncbi:hypothetical protein [Microtetraspora malaysiensis]